MFRDDEGFTDDSSFDGTNDVISATECTGLMPALPVTGQQDESAARLYAIHSAAGVPGGKTCEKRTGGRRRSRRPSPQ